MGQYFIAINHDKREWIHPHRFGCGLKFGEFTETAGGFMAAFAWLMRHTDHPHSEYPIIGSWAGDRVSIVGDYSDSNMYHDAYDSYRDVSFDIMRAMVTDAYTKNRLAKLTEWRRQPGYEAAASDSEETIVYRELFGEVDSKVQ